jgi:hypothetical protein
MPSTRQNFHENSLIKPFARAGNPTWLEPGHQPDRRHPLSVRGDVERLDLTRQPEAADLRSQRHVLVQTESEEQPAARKRIVLDFLVAEQSETVGIVDAAGLERPGEIQRQSLTLDQRHIDIVVFEPVEEELCVHPDGGFQLQSQSRQASVATGRAHHDVLVEGGIRHAHILSDRRPGETHGKQNSQQTSVHTNGNLPWRAGNSWVCGANPIRPRHGVCPSLSTQ